MTEIFETLKQDHEAIKQLFEKLSQTSERASKSRERLFEELKVNLLAHAKAEQTTFYDRLESEKETHSEILEAEEEHKLVEHMLKEMSKLDVTDEKFMAKLKVLQENVLHHIEEEEGEIFPDAQEVLDSETAEEMGEAFEEQRKKIVKKAA